MKENLDNLERLHAVATPGPWDAHDYAEGGAGDRRYQIQERAGARRYDKTGSVLGYFEDEQVPTPEARANARLVAAMRNALPDLIAKARAFDACAAETGNSSRPYEDTVRAVQRRDGAHLVAVACGDALNKAVEAGAPMPAPEVVRAWADYSQRPGVHSARRYVADVRAEGYEQGHKAGREAADALVSDCETLLEQWNVYERSGDNVASTLRAAIDSYLAKVSPT